MFLTANLHWWPQPIPKICFMSLGIIPNALEVKNERPENTNQKMFTFSCNCLASISKWKFQKAQTPHFLEVRKNWYAMIVIHSQFALVWPCPHAARDFQVVMNHQMDAWPRVSGNEKHDAGAGTETWSECKFWIDPFGSPSMWIIIQKLPTKIRSGVKYVSYSWEATVCRLHLHRVKASTSREKKLVAGGRSLYYLGVLFRKRLFRSCREIVYNYFGQTF